MILLQRLAVCALYFMFLSNFTIYRIIIVLFIYQFVSVHFWGRGGGYCWNIGEKSRKNEENNIYMLTATIKMREKRDLKAIIIFGTSMSVLLKCYILYIWYKYTRNVPFQP